MNTHLCIAFGPHDVRNPGHGYYIKIERTDGSIVFHADVDPMTGDPLLTVADCVRVAGYYVA